MDIKGLNLGLRFVLELCLLAALGYWGFHVGESLAVEALLGLGAPILVAIVWGMFISPKAPKRLRDPFKAIVESDLFTLGVVALAFSERIVLAVVLGVAAAVNIGLMFLFEQRAH